MISEDDNRRDIAYFVTAGLALFVLLFLDLQAARLVMFSSCVVFGGRVLIYIGQVLQEKRKNDNADHSARMD